MQVAVWDSQAYADVANSRFQSIEGSVNQPSCVYVGQCSWMLGRNRATPNQPLQLLSPYHVPAGEAVLPPPRPAVFVQLP